MRPTRVLLTVVLALVAVPPAGAQVAVAGAAVDASTRTPLACADVALEDSAGRTFTVGRTDGRGLFQLPAPGAGAFRLRFEIANHEPLRTAWDTASADSVRTTEYRLAFVDPTPSGVPVPKGPVRPPEDAADAPFWPANVHEQPLYPPQLRMAEIDGDVLVQFVLDSAGRVDWSTYRVVRSTAPAFTAAVETYLHRTHYRPARRGGRPVCALARIPFTFRVLHQ